MKFQQLSALAIAAAPGVLSAFVELDASFVPPLADAVVNSEAIKVFVDPSIKTLVTVVDHLVTRYDEPDPNRDVTLEDGLVFVVQCTDAGFRGDCLVFGAPPGQCVSYFSFQNANETTVSDIYNSAVTSLSTNTGGLCQFYKYLGCDNKGDDRGLSSSYNYNLAVAAASDPRTVEYENAITSWRC